MTISKETGRLHHPTTNRVLPNQDSGLVPWFGWLPLTLPAASPETGRSSGGTRVTSQGHCGPGLLNFS